MCSKEPSHWDGSFEYPQHMFWLRNSAVEEGRRREVKQSEIPDSAQSPSEEEEEEESEDSESDSGSGMGKLWLFSYPSV